MKLDGSYEFSELTQVEGIFLSNGREKASGKLVQIHLFPAGKSQEANRICQQLFSLPDDARAKILKYGQEGSASYFVTDPLPEGEFLQSWVNRLCAPPKAAPAPEMSLGLTGQLRQMGIAPAALAPLMPGPEKPRNAGAPPRQDGSQPGEFTRLYRRDDLASERPVENVRVSPPPSGADTGFTQIYGRDRSEADGLPPVQMAEEPTAPPEETPKDFGLETFIGLRPKTSPAPAPPSPPVLPAIEPLPQPPVFSQEPSRISFEIPQYAPPSPPRPEPTPPPLVQAAARPRASNLDWKILLVTAGILIVVATILVAVVERAS